jgi:aspartate aminotransferase
MSDIEEHRKKIEEITLEMIKLLKTRTDIAKQIGDAKASLGMTVTDEEREDMLRNQVVKLCKEIDLDQSTALKFLNFLFNESVKVQSDSKQTHLSVFLKAKALEEQGKKIIHLEVGEPDFKPPKEVKTALEEVYDKGYGKYGPAKGMTELRKILADFGTASDKESPNYDTSRGSATIKENIMVCPGARFAVYLAITTLLNPGDEIIVIEPAWPAYKDCALNAGIKVRTIKTTLETEWEPSVDQIKNTINENTKMIVLNYPNNPTGKILPRKLLDSIVQTAKEHDLYILSDEIYDEYSNDDWCSVSIYGYEKSIITMSFSKSYAMTGYRIGYAIAEPSIIDKMSKLQALSLTNVSEPIQYVALQAIGEIKPSEKQKFADIVNSRLKALVKIAKDIGLEFIEPDGAMYLFAKTKYKDFDATKFSEKLLEYGVAIAPGEGFGDYKEFFRITAIDESKLMEGMTILDTVLKSNQ